METKICSKCGEEKDVTEFYKDKSRKSGLTQWCKLCVTESNEKWRKKNPEKCREKGVRYYHKNPEKCRERSIKYYHENPEKCREKSAKWRKENPDKVRECDAKWRKENPDKHRKINANWNKTPKGKLVKARSEYKRRSLSSQVKNDLTLAQWNTILKTQNNRCAICGNPFCKSRPPTKDHIIPVSKGGGLTFENVQALCQSCNSSKRDKLDHSKIVTRITKYQ